MSFGDCQDRRHGGHLNLNVYFMYNINIFEHVQDMCLLHYNIIQWDSEESKLTYEVCLPFWISERNGFINSKSPCGPNASHQVWVQSDLGFGSKCGFKISLDSQTERCFPLIKFWLNPTYGLGDVV